MRARSSESGSILFLILLAVVLFAALSYAVTSSLRGGGQDSTPEKLKLALGEVQQQASLISATIQRLMLSNDCEETQINFDNDDAVLTGVYTNPNAPISGECDVFGTNGGELAWMDPPGVIFAKYTTEFWKHTYAYTGQVVIPNIGTPKAELLLTFQVRDEPQCQAINKLIDGNAGAVPAATAYCFDPFTGVFDSVANCGLQIWTNLSNKPEYCVTNAGTEWFYYHVLLPR